MINVQSGKFRGAWKKDGPRTTATGLVSRLINTAPYARFLFTGTRLMIARPIDKKVMEYMRGIRYRRLKAAIQKALSGE